MLEALEVIVLRPSSAPTVADALGIHPRTARRILQTLASERYVERRGGRGRAAHEYQPTVRLLALAAQLASRLPLVTAARRAVREAEAKTGATAYVAVPCYSDVLVVAATGVGAVRPWATIQASADAAGWVLLAHREAWRSRLRRVEPALALDNETAAGIVERGYAERIGGGAACRSLAVVVPAGAPPIAALAVRGPSALTDSRQALVGVLGHIAARLAVESRQSEGAVGPSSASSCSGGGVVFELSECVGVRGSLRGAVRVAVAPAESLVLDPARAVDAELRP